MSPEYVEAVFVVLVISTVAAWAMVGLIWLIQLVHYPMLALYSEGLPQTAAVDHARRITPVVGPFMAAEGVTALALMANPPDGVGWLAMWIAAALLGAALLSTIIFSVPQHTALSQGHDPAVAKKLIDTNWCRTIAWTARALVLTYAVIAAGT